MALIAGCGHALAEPQLRRRLLDLAYEMPSREQETRQALRALQRAEIAKWCPITKAEREGRVTPRARKMIVVRR